MKREVLAILLLTVGSYSYAGVNFVNGREVASYHDVTVKNKLKLQATGSGATYVSFFAPSSIGTSREYQWFTNNSGNCSASSNGGVLTINSSNQVVCEADDGASVGEDDIGTLELNDGTDSPLVGECVAVDSADTSKFEYVTCGAGGGDSVSVNGSAATNANFINSSQLFWTLDTAPAPDTLSATIGAGTVTATELGTDSVSADELNATGVESELEAVLDLDQIQGQIGDAQIAAGAVDGGNAGEIADGSVTADDLATDSVSADELNATGVETELEAVLDLDALQGSVTDGQVPNNITIDLATLATTATTANSGDSATAFFSSGQIEAARGGTGIDTSASTGAAYVASGIWSVGTLSASHLGTGSVGTDEIDETADYSFTTISGKQDRNNTAVNDDDCTGEQGNWWYDTTDSVFEFCNDNSGAPATTGGGGVGGSTAWSSIGDAADVGTIDFAGFDQDITSAEDGGDILTITNSDATRASDTAMLKLSDNDTADANAIYLQAISDADGTPATDYKLSQTLATLGVPLDVTQNAGANISGIDLDCNDVDDICFYSNTFQTSNYGHIFAFNSMVSGVGVYLDSDVLVSGSSFQIQDDSSGLTSGKLLTMNHSVSGSLSGKTDQFINVLIQRLDTDSHSFSDDYDLASFRRQTTKSAGTGTYTSTGSVLYLSNTGTQSSGTLTDSANGLEILMEVTGTGDAVNITQNNTGATSAEGIDLTTLSTTADAHKISGTNLTTGDALQITVDNSMTTGRAIRVLGGASGTTEVFNVDDNGDTVIGDGAISTSLSVNGAFTVDGTANTIQLRVQANATQTSNLVVFEKSDGTDAWTVDQLGNSVQAGSGTFGGTDQSTITEGLVVNNGNGTDEDDDFTVKASGGTYEIDAGAGTFISSTNDAGWTAVDGADNTACTTICTSACLFGVENATGTAVTGIVSCSNAAADTCVCMGAS